MVYLLALAFESAEASEVGDHALLAVGVSDVGKGVYARQVLGELGLEVADESLHLVLACHDALNEALRSFCREIAQALRAERVKPSPSRL